MRKVLKLWQPSMGFMSTTFMHPWAHDAASAWGQLQRKLLFIEAVLSFDVPYESLIYQIGGCPQLAFVTTTSCSYRRSSCDAAPAVLGVGRSADLWRQVRSLWFQPPAARAVHAALGPLWDIAGHVM